ncbi:hypothetical protein [Halostella litorea]|uniref:hypothetical protein n=1 Tax=Halostella litorea TaxID=2528831 RepID=UPI001092768C|nr:hypothetical protein [Halostella litorea]
MDGTAAFDPVDELARVLSAYFAVDAVRDVLEAVDLAAVLGDAPVEEAVDYDEAVRTVGRLSGRLLVRDVVGRSPAGPVVETLGGQAVGATAGEAAADLLVETVDPEAFLAALESDLGVDLGVSGIDPDDAVTIEIETPDDE